jgi:hypothetical protein
VASQKMTHRIKSLKKDFATVLQLFLSVLVKGERMGQVEGM